MMAPQDKRNRRRWLTLAVVTTLLLIIRAGPWSKIPGGAEGSEELVLGKKKKHNCSRCCH